ncbi:pantothenate kinase [Fortiea contorta]|uniref:pantothenate kinase n=1 Tax=Fortiea contorta TaxID=1892405 RepID=UPI00034ABC7F|nr:pantothenate kinase [Fortiea contorta]
MTTQLALMVGNSRLHWALLINNTLDSTWDTDYQPESVIQRIAESSTVDDLPPEIFPPHHKREKQQQIIKKNSSPLPLLLASVVPTQTALWQTYPHIRLITLDQIPLKRLYPTLGIDRALALWGAGKQWGFPILVIDAGTALTFTGADANQCLVGGAILPGLGLQFATLGQKTGQLPQIETHSVSLPPRFALNTSQAIQSGVIYTLVAGIKDFMTAWWELFPESNIAITGGDRHLIVNYLQEWDSAIATKLIIEPNLIFWGMQKIAIDDKSQLTNSP